MLNVYNCMQIKTQQIDLAQTLQGKFLKSTRGLTDDHGLSRLDVFGTSAVGMAHDSSQRNRRITPGTTGRLLRRLFEK